MPAMLRFAALVFVFGLAVAAPAGAGETLPEPAAGLPTPQGAARAPSAEITSVSATVVRILDGDTIAVRARIWLGQDVETSVRVLGVDTPETGPRAKCESERARGAAAKRRVAELLKPGARVTLAGVKPDKYAGRVLARVALPDGRDLAQLLIAEGLARPYAGGARGGWCG